MKNFYFQSFLSYARVSYSKLKNTKHLRNYQGGSKSFLPHLVKLGRQQLL